MVLNTAQAANAMAELFDTPLLKALSEPARIGVLKVLLASGGRGGDVASVAEQLPQDRSVISRHLKALEEAGILRSERQGRHRIYELDGEEFVMRFDVLARRLKELAPLCCPPRSPTNTPATNTPATNTPATNTPATNTPATNTPATKKSATKKSATKKSATKKSATKKSATKESATKKSARQ